MNKIEEEKKIVVGARKAKRGYKTAWQLVGTMMVDVRNVEVKGARVKAWVRLPSGQLVNLLNGYRKGAVVIAAGEQRKVKVSKDLRTGELWCYYL